MGRVDSSAIAWDEQEEGEAVASARSEGLTSLDIAIPQRGAEFLFTTPLGASEVTARLVAADQVDQALTPRKNRRCAAPAARRYQTLEVGPNLADPATASASL